MQATVGDRLHVHGKCVGISEQMGEIVEVRGAQGAPPYLVRFSDGHTGLIYPGPDAVIEHMDAAQRDTPPHAVAHGRRVLGRLGW